MTTYTEVRLLEYAFVKNGRYGIWGTALIYDLVSYQEWIKIEIGLLKGLIRERDRVEGIKVEESPSSKSS